MKRFLKVFAVLAGVSAVVVPAAVYAAGEYDKPRDARFSFASLLGTFDRGSAQRGFQVYNEVCAACHGMRLLSFRNLLEIGLTEEQVRAIAANVQVTDGPNDEGQMFERPGRLSDRFRVWFPGRSRKASTSCRATTPRPWGRSWGTCPWDRAGKPSHLASWAPTSNQSTTRTATPGYRAARAFRWARPRASSWPRPRPGAIFW